MTDYNNSPPPSGNFFFDGSVWRPVSAVDPMPVNASVSVSASIDGFTPNGAVSTPLAVTASSGNVALPSGTTVVVTNSGGTLAFVKLGGSGVVATTSDIVVPSGGSVGLTVGANTFLAGVTATGTTTLNLAGGAGLFTGTGGTGSGGGIASTVTLAAGVAAVGTVAVSGTVPVSGTVAVAGVIGGTVTLAAGVANVGTIAVSNFPATQAVSGTVGISAGSATIGALVANQSVNLAQVAGATVATGHGLAAGAVRVELPTDGTGIVGLAAGTANIGTVAVAGGLSSIVTLAAGAAQVGTVAVSGTPAISGTVTANLGTLNGAATAANQTAVTGSATGGTAATSSELVGGVFNTSLPTLTNGQQGAIQLDASGRQIIGTSTANIGTVAVTGTSAVSGTVALAAGAAAVGTVAVSNFPGTQTIGGTVTLAAGAATIGALTANQSVNLNQVGGATVVQGHGVAANAIRVELPTDGTGVVFATPNAGTTGGATPATLVTAASNNQTTVKGSAGVLYGVQGVSVANAAAMWIKFFDATSITPGTTAATYQIGIPAAGTSQGAGAIWYVPIGIQHTTGIIAMVTGGIALADNTSAVANAAAITFLYK